LEVDNYQLEEIARTYLGLGIQNWGQSVEQREKATRAYVEAAGLKFGSMEANEWIMGVVQNLWRGKFETEVDQLVAAITNRRAAA
jgi:aspartate aminotransferase-like enzyme